MFPYLYQIPSILTTKKKENIFFASLQRESGFLTPVTKSMLTPRLPSDSSFLPNVIEPTTGSRIATDQFLLERVQQHREQVTHGHVIFLFTGWGM